MKKQLYILTLLSLIVLFVGNYAFAEGSANIKIGLDVSGDHEISLSGISQSDGVETGFSLSGEYIFANYDKLGLGAGVTYQIPRKVTDWTGNFSFIPLYGLIKIYLASDEFSPYFTGQAGYNLFTGDSAYKSAGIVGSVTLGGGLYYGVGGGIITGDKFQIEALYSVNNGTAELLGIAMDVKYSKFALSFGMRF